MSANVPLNLGLLRMLDRLGGQKSSRIPELLEGIQPVVVYSDLSSSITSELFEPRGLLGCTVSPIMGFWGGVELVANAPGGILIDRITARQTFDNNGMRVAVNGFSSFTAGAITPVTILDCGGAPATSSASTNAQIVALPPNAQQVWLDQGFVQDLLTPRIYVPPGFIFLLTADPTGTRIDVTITWRELTDSQGGQ